MTPRERLLCVLDGGIPDRVPSFELLVDEGFRRAVRPDLDFYDFQEALGFDMVLFGLGNDPVPLQWEDAGRRIFRDKWGVRQQFTTESMPILVEHEPLVDSMADLARYQPPDPVHPAVMAQVREVVRRFRGRLAVGYLGEATFAVQQHLRGGLERLLTDYAEGSELPGAIAGMAADYHCELYRNVIREGVDVVVLGDDYAGKTGPFLSPAHFREYLLPGLERVVRTCKEVGAYVIKHADGDLWPILDQIAGTGVDALGPLEPLPAMQLSRVQAAFPSVTVVGNIDVALLSTGTVEEVREATRACIADAAPGGRFILSSGNSITSSVKPELYQALIDAKREYGAYPVRAGSCP